MQVGPLQEGLGCEHGFGLQKLDELHNGLHELDGLQELDGLHKPDGLHPDGLQLNFRSCDSSSLMKLSSDALNF